MGSRGRRRDLSGMRTRTAGTIHYVEQGFYIAIASALAVGGLVLLGASIYRFAVDLGERSTALTVLELLDQLLLVFIFTELIHTIRAIIAQNVLLTEPFLIVGIVAAIRRLIVISAEAPEFVGRADFNKLMLEMGILVAAVLALGLTIYLLRHTEHGEPRPAHEPEVEGDG